MAGTSRPSLRSSARQHTGLQNDTSPTVGHHHPKSHFSHPDTRKRAHETISPNCDPIFTKKQKLDNTDSRLRSTDRTTRNHVSNSFVASLVSPSLLDKSSSLAVTHPLATSSLPSRTSGAVQPLADGTIVTNGNSPLTHVDVEVVNGVVEHNGGGADKTVKAVDKRTLRSQDGGSRSKSELSLYFPNYEELVGNEPKEPEFLTPTTRILIIDENPKSLKSPTSSTTTHSPPVHITSIDLSPPPQLIDRTTQTSDPSVPRPHPTFTTLDFTTIPPCSTPLPLPDTLYHPSHRRSERREKQLRNIEKERAQHEKVQLERLLQGLLSHDWLRVMGISGITDSERKLYEPKRDYFVTEVKALIEKFRRWKEEEKRRKVEKDTSAKAESEVGDTDGGDGDARARPGRPDDGDKAIGGDVDALAELQLHHESLSAAHSRPRQHAASSTSVLGALLLLPPPIEKPFTSFFRKKYMRDAALGKHRRGRTRFAFGHAVPTVGDGEFALPRGWLTEEAIRASRRRTRRVRRGRVEGE